jgi:predicted nucleic acid-binding protein
VTLVVDSGLFVAALTDNGPTGRWAGTVLGDDDLEAPHHMLAEVAIILRRMSLSRGISPDVAALAHGDLVAAPIRLHPYEPLAARIWELRENVTPNDAWYVALAERLDAPLATLDLRLARAPGPRCAFLTP